MNNRQVDAALIDTILNNPLLTVNDLARATHDAFQGMDEQMADVITRYNYVIQSLIKVAQVQGEAIEALEERLSTQEALPRPVLTGRTLQESEGVDWAHDPIDVDSLLGRDDE